MSHISLKNKTILVTGGTGFIGSHLVEKLINLNTNVSVLITKSLGNISHLKDKLTIIKKDITENLDLEEYDIVFHLAAFTDIKEANKNPKKVFNVNTYGTLNLLEACKKKVKKFIYLDTLGVYGNSKQIPVDEKQPTIPTELYSASKLAGENFVLAFGSAYNMNNIIVRVFNVYGPRQNENFIVPSIMKQCLKNDKVRLGNLKPTRDFIFVKDVIDALILIAEKGENNNIYNVGTGIETSIGDLAKKIMKLTNKNISLEIVESRKKNMRIEVMRSKADISKINKLGWKPKTSLEEGLKETLRYYENDTR